MVGTGAATAHGRGSWSSYTVSFAAMTTTERQPLTRARILAAAVELVDADGLDALSMRRLGAAVGVEAMSLYNHVANKDDVLDGLLDVLVCEIELPDRSEPWDDQLRAIAGGFRRAGHRHPRIFPLFGTRAITSIEGIEPLEQSFTALREAGLDADQALDAFVSLAAFAFGYVLIELGGLVDVTEGNAVAVLAVDEQHPRLTEMGVAFLARDADRQFAFGLEQNLRGLADVIAGATAGLSSPA